MPDKLNWLTLGIIAFLGGVVANIVVPARRGVYGFASAAIIGVFCGGVAGMIAASYEVHSGLQYLVTATVGVLGDRILSFVMTLKREGTTINIQDGITQIGDHNNQR